MNETQVCEKGKCVGCKACIASCSKNALIMHDEINSQYVSIDLSKCIGCNSCRKVCQVWNPLPAITPIMWKQGWANSEIRKNSSSGGFATQIMENFVDSNSYVCTCSFHESGFFYCLTNNVDDISKYTGSKYVKSDVGNIYKKIQELLRLGNRVLFIGLPCHVAAIKKYIKKEYWSALYTIDLICHGTPSSKLFYHFIQEYGYQVHDISNVAFRQKNQFGISINNQSISPVGALDRYTLAFLRGLFYTENCYGCAYAKLDRISDITLGDSWGTELKREEHKGISLAICQTEKGKQLLMHSKLKLFEVDLEKAIAANHQLREPSVVTEKRSLFFEDFFKTKSVKHAVFKCYPVDCCKQEVKGILIKMHIL